ncbi:MAG: type 1 glutamine amidotransferase [Actinomycetes bacterium]
MRVLFMQHDAFSPPRLVSERFAELGFEVVEELIVEAAHYNTPGIVTYEFPDPTNFDVIVPMGSPWGAWDDEQIGGWLLPELEWLKTADEHGVPVMGICFGGQLLARAHGGSVGRAPDCEIGWTSVWSDDESLVPPGPWFSFHYDRWTLPPEATEIARTSRASQAFTLRKNLALQFHPELTGDMLQGWYTSPGDGRDLIIADGQDPDVLLAYAYAEEQKAQARAHALVDSFLTKVAGLGHLVRD